MNQSVSAHLVGLYEQERNSLGYLPQQVKSSLVLNFKLQCFSILNAFWQAWDTPTFLMSMSHKFSSDFDINVPPHVPTMLPRSTQVSHEQGQDL